MLTRRLRQALRRSRAAWQRWSPERDRAYHDSLFGAQQLDPFRHSYPGNITIRRFADLSAPYVSTSRHGLDLGCGAGEITCELARRYPDTTLEGVDHSQAGVARATTHVKTLGLRNATFAVADVERFEPSGPVDLVMMFDAFHHLTDPAAFVQRLGWFSRRFLLVEPRGDWKGSWSKELDFDWLVHDLDRIREHIAYATGEPTPPAAPTPVPSQQVEEPVEHRYTVDDFERFFVGYGLEVRGTVAGLDSYPPTPELDTPSRDRFGRLAYDLYAEVDDRLHERNLDLLAKHLVIYAEHGRQVPRRVPPARPDNVDWTSSVRGSYDVRYLGYHGPREARPDVEVLAEVTLRNESWRQLSSAHEKTPDFLSYHWLDRGGAIVRHDGLRSALPRIVSPGEQVAVALKVRTPNRRGRYVLAVDLVREGTTWYSDAGSPCLRLPFRVQ